MNIVHEDFAITLCVPFARTTALALTVIRPLVHLPPLGTVLSFTSSGVGAAGSPARFIVRDVTYDMRSLNAQVELSATLINGVALNAEQATDLLCDVAAHWNSWGGDFALRVRAESGDVASFDVSDDSFDPHESLATFLRLVTTVDA